MIGQYSNGTVSIPPKHPSTLGTELIRISCMRYYPPTEKLRRVDLLRIASGSEPSSEFQRSWSPASDLYARGHVLVVFWYVCNVAAFSSLSYDLFVNVVVLSNCPVSLVITVSFGLQ